MVLGAARLLRRAEEPTRRERATAVILLRRWRPRRSLGDGIARPATRSGRRGGAVIDSGRAREYGRGVATISCDPGRDESGRFSGASGAGDR
jgi:hypothetical protein